MRYVDQTGYAVEVPAYPERIVSLVPSQTELLFDLGVGERVAGVTWFCVHPGNAVREITKVGGTKRLKLDVIRDLKPDLIIANKEENEKAQITRLRSDYPVWTSDVRTFDDALDMISAVGGMVGKEGIAHSLVANIRNAFSGLSKSSTPGTLYFIWRKPYMAAGNDTFIHEMMSLCGLRNAMADHPRYPVLTPDAIKAINPEVVLLSTEPFPFSDRHVEEMKEILPGATVKIVDGEMFSWYGSRMLKAAEYLKELNVNLKK